MPWHVRSTRRVGINGGSHAVRHLNSGDEYRLRLAGGWRLRPGPEISAITLTVDGSCNISITLTLDGSLIYGDSHILYVDTDGNPATGSPTFDGSDVAVITIGRTGIDDAPVMTTWNGTG